MIEIKIMFYFLTQYTTQGQEIFNDFYLLLITRIGYVNDMNQEVRFLEFLQGRFKRFQQFLGKMPDKTDCISNNHFSVNRNTESSTGRIKSGK